MHPPTPEVIVTTNSQLTLGATAPGLPAELMQEFQDFTPEEIALLVESVQLAQQAFCLTAKWIESMRALRNKLHERNGGFPPGCGWDLVCAKVYRLPRNNANAMIRGWEAFFLENSRALKEPMDLLGDPAPSFFREVGNVPDKLRAKMVEALSSGEIPPTTTGVQAYRKVLKTEAGQVKLKAVAPPKAPAAPKLPTRQNSGQGQGMSVSKWTAEGTPQGDRMEKEFAYLAGAKTGNETFQAAINGARKGSSRSGKITRMQVLAAALHAECKAVSDRYQLENEKARDWKRYMTVWQHHWSDTDQLDMAASLKQIASEMAEASRHFEIMGQLSWSDKVRLEE